MQPSRTDEDPYERFFGLREPAFALTTDPRFHFKSASHRTAFDELRRGLERDEGFLLLTGDTGTGKTTLSRAVIDSLGGRTFSTIITNPAVADAELLRVILRDFGVVSREELRRGKFEAADAQHLLETLESFLRSLAPLGARAVLVVDEAQGLAPRTLEQIRVLGNMEMDGRRLIQIVLSGQRRLETTLAADDLSQLNQRISRRVRLEPLSQEETEQYIGHRLRVAGGEAQVGFTPEAIALVHRRSRGVPRAVNLLCDRALNEARADGAATVAAEHVKRAAKALDTGLTGEPIDDDAATPRRSKRRAALVVTGEVLLLLIALALGYAGWLAWKIDTAPLHAPVVPGAPGLEPRTIPPPSLPAGWDIVPPTATPQPPDPQTSRPFVGA
ncbi:MAG: AAA family ATPase [Acidobacteriota bacterium]|nr:AAA family ATPase [Acidobacteriota bacterium]